MIAIPSFQFAKEKLVDQCKSQIFPNFVCFQICHAVLMFKKLWLFSIVLISFQLTAQQRDIPPEDWYHQSSSHPVFPGISSHYVYNNILKDTPARPVIVAILDTGVDIEHEDLKDNVWTNSDEIPDNGIDDDNNGYIDDIHGWNFIGNENGANVHHDSYEVTRLYSKLRNQFENINPESLKGREREEFNLFSKCKLEVESKREEASEYLFQIESAEKYLLDMIHSVKTALDGKELTIENLDSIDYKEDEELFSSISFMRTIHQENGFLPTFSQLEEGIQYQFEFQKEPIQIDLDYSYNPDFNSREIIGDDYSDPNQRFYGNNDVTGERAMHGTHVAGIIAAVRNNGIGIDGIAHHAKIMTLRMLPDGDEHDKDVANAIRYAVENGASIINMSFGKYYEWDKEAVDEAVRYAEKNDVLLVHAAGNEANNNDELIHFPSRKYKSPKGFLWFRDKEADNWIEVGALSWKKDDNLAASFSNYGPEDVDIFAPGTFIKSTINDNEYRVLQGTSMAAPMVTGVAAVLRSYFPTLTAKQIKEVMLESSSTYDLQVRKPGSNEMVAFSELSKSGGILNLESAILLAARTKGKKKLKTVKVKEKERA